MSGGVRGCRIKRLFEVRTRPAEFKGNRRARTVDRSSPRNRRVTAEAKRRVAGG